MAANFLLQLPAAEALPISMTSLDVTDNRLTTLPADIGRLSALRSLLCGRNLLAALPPAVNAYALSHPSPLNIINNHGICSCGHAYECAL